MTTTTNLIEINGDAVVRVVSDALVLCHVQDALDLMADCSYNYNGADKIIINEEQISPAFFDLKTGLAGEILQKFSNYRCKMAIIGDFSKYKSQSLKDFIAESNKTGRIFFVGSYEEAIKRLLK